MIRCDEHGCSQPVIVCATWGSDCIPTQSGVFCQQHIDQLWQTLGPLCSANRAWVKLARPEDKTSLSNAANADDTLDGTSWIGRRMISDPIATVEQDPRPMWMNQAEIEWAVAQRHDCPNVQKGVRLLLQLMQAVNTQSDGWPYWRAPARAAEKLTTLLQSAGNLQCGTRGTITDAQLKAAITPIRAMVARQKKLQADYGNTFEFDVDAVLAD